MTATDDTAGTELDAGALRPWNVVAISLSAISPTTSVFLVYGSGLEAAGTGVVWGFVVAGVIAVAMALCYAEVGSVFPSVGGAYTIVRRALGSVAGGVTAVLFAVLGLTSTASILVSAATYLTGLLPGQLPVGAVALLLMVLVTALSVGRIAPASWVAAAMLALELAVVLVFAAVALANPAPTAPPIAPPVTATGPASISLVLAAVAPALFAFNGYDWPLYFAEESRGSRRALPRAVLVSVGVAVVVEILAVVAATGAIDDLGRVGAADAPLSLVAHDVLGPVGATILLVGVVIAMFDTGLAANLGYARILYAAARDRLVAGPPGRFLGHLSPRSRVPTGAFALLFVGNGVLCVFAGLDELITFTSVVIVVVYLLVAVSALSVRLRDRDRPRSFRMPLWPVPPLLAIAGCAVALRFQSVADVAIAGGLALVALVVYLLVRRRLPARSK